MLYFIKFLCILYVVNVVKLIKVCIVGFCLIGICICSIDLENLKRCNNIFVMYLYFYNKMCDVNYIIL